MVQVEMKTQLKNLKTQLENPQGSRTSRINQAEDRTSVLKDKIANLDKMSKKIFKTQRGNKEEMREIQK